MKATLVSSTALDMENDFGFTVAELAIANRAVITSIDKSINIAWRGAVPTTTLGIFIKGTNHRILTGQLNIATLQVIADGTDANVTIVLERV